MTDLRALLAPIRARLEPALFHAPYIVDGRKVIQANNHPSLGPYMLSDNSMPVIAEFIANAPTDLARLLAAIETVGALHKPRLHDPVMDGVWHGQSDAGQYELCAHDRQRFPCPTITALAAALGSDTTNQEDVA